MSFLTALFSHRESTSIRRVTLGALSMALRSESVRPPVQPHRPPLTSHDESAIRTELSGASLQLRADPAVPFLATLAPVTLGGDSTSSALPENVSAPHLEFTNKAIIHSPQPLADGVGLLAFGLSLEQSCQS